MDVDILQTLTSHTDASKQASQHLMFADAIKCLCHRITGCACSAQCTRDVSVRGDKTRSSVPSTPPFTDQSCFVDLSAVCQHLFRGNHAHRPHHVTVLLLARNTINVHPATGWQPRCLKPLFKMSIAFGTPSHSTVGQSLRTQHSPMARSNSLSLTFAIIQHLLNGSQYRRSNVMSSLLFVLSSFSINSGSPC